MQYVIMDENHVLPYCLHNGAIPVGEVKYPEDARARAEAGKGLPHGPVVPFLRAIARIYGATGIMAVDGDSVIGKIRFAPMDGCVQTPDQVMAIGALDLSQLTPKEDLSPKSLSIWCIQVIAQYRGQGVGTSLLAKSVDWARENGWDEIRSLAGRHIRPLLEWTGMPSIDRLRRLGFQEVSHSVHDELKKAVIAMRTGQHGEDVRRQWESYADLSDDEASWVYETALNL